MATNNHSVVYLGADHAGFALKEQVAGWLTDHGYEVRDLGASEPWCPTIILLSPIPARAVVKDQARGLLFCGSAEGVCIGQQDGWCSGGDCLRWTRLVQLRSDEDANVLLARAHDERGGGNADRGDIFGNAISDRSDMRVGSNK